MTHRRAHRPGARDWEEEGIPGPDEESPPGRRRITLSVLEEGEVGERPVLRADLSHEETALLKIEDRGASNLVMECGRCGAPIVEGLEVRDMPDFVLACNICGAYNVLPS